MRYKPIKIELREDLGIVSRAHAEKYEKEIIRSLIKERGLNNVRGGDLTDTDDYLQRFGYYVTKGGWEVLTIVTLLALGIVYLLIDKYFL